jgi:hypothetical protein
MAADGKDPPVPNEPSAPREPRPQAPDLSRPKWTNWIMVLGLLLFWAGFILWVLK